MTSPPSSRDPSGERSDVRQGHARFAVILTWPDVKNAEYEVVQRICIAARNIGAGVTVVDNDGYPLWSSFDEVAQPPERIDSSNYDFAISLHFESPKLFDMYTYTALWNPLEFYFMFGYEPSAMKLASHDDALSCGSVLADGHAANLFASLSRTVPTPFPTLYHSPAQPYFEPNITAESRLFYIGINWERLGRAKGRHHELLERLDEENLIYIYGPDVFQGGRPWEGFKNYRGPIPFDGQTVIRRVNEAGICLAFSSKAHQQNGIMSNRLFESLAAGAATISNRHPFVERYLSDCVYVVDDEALDPVELKDAIRDIVLEVRRDPEAAAARARRGQERLLDLFSLEGRLRDLIDGHAARSIATRPYMVRESRPRVSVLLVHVDGSWRDFERTLENVDRQAAVEIDLHVVCDVAFRARHRTAFDRRLSRFARVTIHDAAFFSPADPLTRTARRVGQAGPAIRTALGTVDGDFFCLLRRDDHWFGNHLASLADVLVRRPADSFAASGLLIEDGATPSEKHERRTIELACQNRVPLVYANTTGQGGRFLYRSSVIADLPATTFDLLDGRESNLLNLVALIASGDVGQSNATTYAWVEHEYRRLPQPMIPAEQQDQFIRDAFTGHPVWQRLRSGTHHMPPVVFSTPAGVAVRWDRYARTRTDEVPVALDAPLATCSGGTGAPYLGDGFSRLELDHVWIDGTSGEISLLVPDTSGEHLTFVASLFARPAPLPSRAQGVTILLNGFPLAYARVSEVGTVVRAPLPPKLLEGDRAVRLTLVADWAEPLLHADGSVADARQLGIGLQRFAIVTDAPDFQVGHRYGTHLGGSGGLFLRDGFSHPEREFTWIDGRDAILAFRLNTSDDDLAIELTVHGRRGPDGSDQVCTIELGDGEVGRVTVPEAATDITIPLGRPLEGGTVRLALRLAHAEQPIDETGAVVDPRRLSMAVRRMAVVRTGRSRSEAGAGAWARPAQHAEPVGFNHAYHVHEGGDGVAFLGTGFGMPERDGAWTLDGPAELRLRFLDRPRTLTFLARLRSAPFPPGQHQQGVTVSLNGTDARRAVISAGGTTVTVPLPADAIGEDGEAVVSLTPDWSDSPRDRTGKVVDGRQLGLALESFSLLSAAPGLEIDTVYPTGEGGTGQAFLLSGFSYAEEKFTWIDGEEAELAFRVDGSARKVALQLTVAGRSSAGGVEQSCRLVVNGVEAGTFRVPDRESEQQIEIGSVTVGDVVRVRLVLAHAEPVRDPAGRIVDPRRLSMSVSSVALVEQTGSKLAWLSRTAAPESATRQAPSRRRT